MIAAILFAADLYLRTPDFTCRVRDKQGHLVRSKSRRDLFRKMTGYPKGRPGYVADHVVPLACGGCDVPSNFQWLTVEEWREKTRWERSPCADWFNGKNAGRKQPAATLPGGGYISPTSSPLPR